MSSGAVLLGCAEICTVDGDIIGIFISKVHTSVSLDGSWNNHGETPQNILPGRSLRTPGPEAAVDS